MSCPEINFELFKENLNKISQATGEDILSELKTLSQESCPSTGGKRKMRGGALITRRNIKIMIYVLLAVIMTLASRTPTAESILTGIEMVINGECGYLINRIWGIVGLENPVCALNNKISEAIIFALRGNQEAIALLTGYTVMILAAPTATIMGIDQIAARIENAVNNKLPTIEGVPEEDLSGGKTKRRRSYRKKSRRHRK